MWNYLTAPFCFMIPRFREQGSSSFTPRMDSVLEVTFPENVPTYGMVQKFYYNDKLMLRMMEYTTDMAKRVVAINVVILRLPASSSRGRIG